MVTFRELFGDTTRIRVMESITDGLPMTTREWATEAGLNVKYVYKELPRLLRLGIVTSYRNPEMPRKKLYIINRDSPLARSIRSVIVELPWQERAQGGRRSLGSHATRGFGAAATQSFYNR